MAIILPILNTIINIMHLILNTMKKFMSVNHISNNFIYFTDFMAFEV